MHDTTHIKSPYACSEFPFFLKKKLSQLISLYMSSYLTLSLGKSLETLN